MAANRTSNRPERVKNLREQPTAPAVPMAHLWHSNSKLFPINTAEFSLASLRRRKFSSCGVRVTGAHPEPLAAGEGKALLPPRGSLQPPAPPNLLTLLLLWEASCRSCLRPDDTESAAAKPKHLLALLARAAPHNQELIIPQVGTQPSS